MMAFSNYNSASDPNQKAILVTSKHRTNYVPKLGKQTSREAPVPFMLVQSANNESHIIGIPDRVPKHVMAPISFERTSGRDQGRSRPDEDFREYQPKTYDEWHPKPTVDMGKGSKKDATFLGGGVGTETVNVTHVLDPFKYPQWGSVPKKNNPKANKVQTARAPSPTKMHQDTVAQKSYMAGKHAMREMNISPTREKRVPGPGQYTLPELTKGRTAEIAPLPQAPKNRRRSPTHGEEEDEMMMGAYGFIEGNTTSGPGSSSARKTGTSKSGATTGRRSGAGKDTDLDLSTLKPEIGPGHYKIPTAFEKPVYGWSPRGTIGGTPRKENQGLGIDLFQASLRPGPGQYNVATTFGKGGKRDRSCRVTREEERFHAFCSKPKPPPKQRTQQQQQQQSVPTEQHQHEDGGEGGGYEEGGYDAGEQEASALQ